MSTLLAPAKVEDPVVEAALQVQVCDRCPFLLCFILYLSLSVKGLDYSKTVCVHGCPQCAFFVKVSVRACAQAHMHECMNVLAHVHDSFSV